MTPRFSIAIPAYDRSAYLEQALRSCLMQTVENFEVVVSDDCSSEDLKAVVASFRDPRLRYSRSETRLLAARNHQRAVELSSGTYVVNLHSDDMLLPHYLARAGEVLEASPGAAAVYSSTAYLRGAEIEGCQPLPTVDFADERSYQQMPWLGKSYSTAPTSCLFRRESFDRVRGYRLGLRMVYDWDLYMRFMRMAGGVLFLPEVLAIYRRHAEQSVFRLSHEGFIDLLDLWQQEEYAHWPAWEIADKAITHVVAGLRGECDPIELLRAISTRGLALRLLGGCLGAVPVRLRRKTVGFPVDRNIRYPALPAAAALQPFGIDERSFTPGA